MGRPAAHEEAPREPRPATKKRRTASSSMPGFTPPAPGQCGEEYDTARHGAGNIIVKEVLMGDRGNLHYCGKYDDVTGIHVIWHAVCTCVYVCEGV